MRAWTDALTDRGIVDPQNDPARIDAAFRYLAAHAETWPAPNALVAVMPEVPREYFRALPKPELTPEEAEAERQRRRAVIAEQAAKLGMQPDGGDDGAP